MLNQNDVLHFLSVFGADKILEKFQFDRPFSEVHLKYQEIIEKKRLKRIGSTKG